METILLRECLDLRLLVLPFLCYAAPLLLLAILALLLLAALCFWASQLPSLDILFLLLASLLHVLSMAEAGLQVVSLLCVTFL